MKYLLPIILILIAFACKREGVKTNDLTVLVTYGKNYLDPHNNLKGADVYLYENIAHRVDDYKYLGSGVVEDLKTGEQQSPFKIGKTDYFGKVIFNNLSGSVYAYIVDISPLAKLYPDMISVNKKFTYLTSLSDNLDECYFSVWPYSNVTFQ